MKVTPLALFDTVERIDDEQDYTYLNSTYNLKDIEFGRRFLKSYKGSKGTFNSYRREIERLLHWSVLIANKTLKEIKRSDIEDFINFIQKPPISWIGKTKPPRFILKEGKRLPNPNWRPFVVYLSKVEHKNGKKIDRNSFELS